MLRIAGIVFLLLSASWYHPVHVSVTNLDLDPGRGTVNLSVKIFADDFQDLILHKYAVQLRITEQKSPEDQIETVNRYIREAIQLEINGKIVESLQFTQSELEAGALWLYYRYDKGNRIRKITIRNTLMLEKYQDQTNLLIVTWNNRQNGYRMNNKNTEMTFNIKQRSLP